MYKIYTQKICKPKRYVHRICFIWKPTVLILLVSILYGSAACFAQKITLSKKHAKLEDVFKEFRKQTGYDFFFDRSLLKNADLVDIELHGVSLREAMGESLRNQPFEYGIEDRTVIIKKKKILLDRIEPPLGISMTVTGKVVDTTGRILEFAIVANNTGNKVVSTDASGQFKLDAEVGDLITVRYLGYDTFTFKVKKDMLPLSVVLHVATNNLNTVAVVSTGYQSLPKERATGAFGTVTAKQLESNPQANLIDRLEGLVPGMQVNVLAGDRTFNYQNTQLAINSTTKTIGNNDYSVNIRGNSTLIAEAFPLVVVDGAISELDMSSINPNDVENITVLKDAAAASIWGVRAANGVIVITTKKGNGSKSPKISFSTNLSIADKPNLGYLKTMNAQQQLAYEKELVDKDFLTNVTPNSYFNSLYFISPGSLLAARLKVGSISQSYYDAEAERLGAIDNRKQISKYLLQDAANQQYNFSVNGGTDYSTYYYSAGYSMERPNTKGNSGERFTATLNNSWKLFKVVTLSTSLKLTSFNYVNNGIPLSALYRPSRSTLLPYELIADADGNGIGYSADVNSVWSNTLPLAYRNWTYNYLQELGNNDNTQKDNNYSANIDLTIPIFKGLTAVGLYTMERQYSKTRVYYSQDTYYFRNLVNSYTSPTGADNSLGITNGGILSNINTTQNNYSLRGQLNYDGKFSNIHQLNVIAGTEIRQTNIGQSMVTLYGYDPQTGFTNTTIDFSTLSHPYQSPSGVSTNFNGGGYPSQQDQIRRYLSYYSNASYTLKDCYVFSGSMRYDDYNNFGLDMKYRATPLYSFGAKWNADQEIFIKKVSWLSSLSLRATFGVNGNISTTTYPFTNIGLSSNEGTTGLNYAGISALADPALKWEKTYVSNFGLDFSLFSSRINGSFDYYNKRGKELLFSFPINNTYTGNIGGSGDVSLLTRNAGSLSGKGIDFNINGVVFKKNKWNISLGGAFSYNTNKINDSKFISSAYGTSFSYYPLGIGYLKGYATDKLFVYRNAGLDGTGQTRIYGKDGNIIDASTNINDIKDLKYAGRTTAPCYGSFNSNMQYKQFSLNALVTYQFGNVFLRPTFSNYITSTFRGTSYNLDADIAKRWQNPGDEADTNVPGITNNYVSVARYIYSDINILSASYIRLRRLALNYQLPVELINKLKIRSANVGLSVNNLGLLWTANKQGYDPDFVSPLGSNYSLPASRSYLFTLSLNL